VTATPRNSWIFFVLASALGACASLWETPWPAPVESLRVRTDDGWELDLRHIAPQGGPARARPVVAQHGVVTNGRNMDLDERHSIARYLASRGFDVWVPSLRGVGPSDRPDGATRRNDWSFDDVAAHDVPAILGFVQARTGAAQVDWVGHSMGGMLLYAHLSRGGGGIRRGATLGSPVRLRWSGKVEDSVRAVSGFAEMAARLPLRGMTRLVMPLHAAWDGPIERMLITPENTLPDVWRRFLSVGVDDEPPSMLAQFASWLERDRFDSADGKTDYLRGLAEVRVPLLVVAGRADALAPPWVVRPAYEALGTDEKKWWVAGEVNGAQADYSHMDLLLGERCADEVWPVVAEWLER